MELFSSLRKPDENEFSSEMFIPTFKSVEFTLETIINKIDNIDYLDESEIKNIILRQHQMILNYDLFLSSDESRTHAQKLFTNVRFLKIFLQIIGLLQLSRDEIVCINKLAYDYYISYEKDLEVSDLLLQLSYQINNVLVIRLSGKLGINGSRMLAMIANSSFKDEKNVHRINTFLIRCNIDLSVQDIIDIYCILFERFTNPFVYTMLEVRQPGMNNEQLKRFDAISCALLAILNSMTSEDIKKVLYNYGYTLMIMNNSYVRFRLKTAVDYPRIISVIKDIEGNSEFEKIVIP